MTKFAHSFEISKRRYHEVDDMILWCKNNIGRGGYIPHEYNSWEIVGIFGNSTFRFKNEKDSVLFALRWL